MVADRGFPAHWGAQPGFFRICTTARSRVATLDGGSTPHLQHLRGTRCLQLGRLSDPHATQPRANSGKPGVTVRPPSAAHGSLHGRRHISGCSLNTRSRCLKIIDNYRCGPGLAPGLRPGTWHLVAGRCFPCTCGEPESPTSPPTRPRSGARHGAMTIETAWRASLEFVYVFGQDGLPMVET